MMISYCGFVNFKQHQLHMPTEKIPNDCHSFGLFRNKIELKFNHTKNVVVSIRMQICWCLDMILPKVEMCSKDLQWNEENN